ncbi:ATP-binding protein [Streptomyces sp. ISL-96]|uniref:ATP-binding protein n=1 Tax=Streptomyces sp. ISL-96 TaxID=2819191 RepID=UPI001BEB17AF|nr:ATP-binding protein [Streptomyces sp. ISL-96]MBT2490905.1 ATP-binding protein [Streptomyces sp. ISL-96]
MTAPTTGYVPHPHIGGRVTVLRALAAWRMEWPGAPRVIVLTGNPGSGRSHLLTGFLMLCDPEFRKRLPLADLDPSTVPPELPAPAVPSAAGLTAAQVGWLLAEHYGLQATRIEDVYAELAALDRTVTVVVPDVDRAGPVRTTGEPARVVREVLKPLATTANVRLLADVPRELAARLVEGLPPGTAQVIDLDESQWADPQGLSLQAEALLSPEHGAPELPFTTDPATRRALAEAIGRRAGTGPLTVQLAVRSILASPAGFIPGDESQLPASPGEALDLHARRLGADPQTLRQLLAPLAFAEGDSLPVELWERLVSTLADKDMTTAIAGTAALTGPFVQSLQTGANSERALLQLLHPAIADEIRSGLPNVRAAQSQIAMALLESVPGQDWSKADPYVRDYIAAHTLEAGLLPQLLTDPGLFVYAAPVPLRAAVEAVPAQALGAPGRTYLRIAPLLTRTQAPTLARAALLESAFVEDELPDFAAAVHRLGLDLPWQTLWSVRLRNISEVTIGTLPRPAEAPTPVAALTVPTGTPGAFPVAGNSDSALLMHSLVQPTLFNEPGPEQLLRLSEQDRAAAQLTLLRGTDQLRVWDQSRQTVVASLISDSPFTGADLSPDGILVAATEHGAKALRIRQSASATS